MPQVSGPVLAKRLAALRPEMKVLFMSGFTDDAVVRHGLLHGETAFIQKPFTPGALAKKVREVLDSSACQAPRVEGRREVEPSPSPSGGTMSALPRTMLTPAQRQRSAPPSLPAAAT